MALLTEAQKDALAIERMIFHAVNSDHELPTFFAEVSPPQCADFFLERIKDTLKGSSYIFAAGAGTPRLIQTVLDAPPTSRNTFVTVSRDLVTRFKQKVGSDRRMAPGVLMFFLLEALGEKLCAIIKYEHQQVVSYSHKKDATGRTIFDRHGNPVVDLEALVDTFTQDRKAMQKSAVIRLDQRSDDAPPTGRVIVVDHSSKRYRDATRHFEEFLDIKREMAPEDMALRLENAAIESIRDHKDEVPREIARAPARHVRLAMARMDGFDHEQLEQFLGAIVQGLPAEAKIIRKFKAKIESCGLATEAFSFEGIQRPPPEYRRIVTTEGVAILYSREVEHKVEICNNPGGGVVVTVRATALEQNDEIDKLPRFSP